MSVAAAGLDLRPFTPEAFAEWEARAIPAFAGEKVRAGLWSEAESLALAQAAHAQLLPHGLATPGHWLCALEVAGTRVGMVWWAEQARAGQSVAYIYNLEIDAAHRRQGHGAAALEAVAQWARERGWAGVSLNVFGHNAGAQALYLQQGFTPTAIQMFRPL